MTPALRTFVLTAHVACSVGWLGAAAAYLALGVFATARGDAQTVRAAYVAMEPIGWFAIVPLALASVLSGLVVSLGTPWGLFQHYWVVFKFALTVFAATILFLHMPAVSALVAAAAETGGADPGGLRSELLHAGGGLVVLVLTTVLGIYKPRGLTPYGRRKQREQSGDAAPTPRWVRVSGFILIVLILLLAGLMLFSDGRHGPGRHASTAAPESGAKPTFAWREFARRLANRSSLTFHASEGWRRGWDSLPSKLLLSMIYGRSETPEPPKTRESLRVGTIQER